MIKLAKYNEDLIKFMSKFDLKRSTSRIMTVLALSIFLVHLSACFFLLSAKMYDFETNTWVFQNGLVDASGGFSWFRSVYWAFQTLTTVGYGDFGAYNGWEIFITCAWMFMGVALYTVVVGSLTIMMTETNALQEDMK